MSHSILHRISFLLYPASQLVMVAVSAVWIVRLQLPEVYLRVVGLLALACIPVDFQLFREVRKTQEADILRERVRMLEEQERVQVAYREQIAADMEDIMKLRREVAEEMDEAVRRLREQEEGSAQERLSRAVDIMGSTAFRLCEHRSADAVATMKLKACEEAGVRPRFSLEIPHNVGGAGGGVVRGDCESRGQWSGGCFAGVGCGRPGRVERAGCVERVERVERAGRVGRAVSVAALLGAAGPFGD